MEWKKIHNENRFNEIYYYELTRKITEIVIFVLQEREMMKDGKSRPRWGKNRIWMPNPGFEYSGGHNLILARKRQSSKYQNKECQKNFQWNYPQRRKSLIRQIYLTGAIKKSWPILKETFRGPVPSEAFDHLKLVGYDPVQHRDLLIE